MVTLEKDKKMTATKATKKICNIKWKDLREILRLGDNFETK